jgi:hypothetical protein
MLKKVEGKVSMPPKIILDDSEKCSTLRTYIEYYELNKEIPISHKFLLLYFREETFWKTVKGMGFSWKKCKNNRSPSSER